MRWRGPFVFLAFLLMRPIPVDGQPSKVAMGREVYERYCVGCHGEKGDGNGIAARDLIVKPRDFTTGIFKFKSTPRGSLPLDSDLKRVIDQGLPLTSMPSFRLLPEPEKDAVIAYIKTFSDRWEEESPGRPLVKEVKVPGFVGTPESIEKGKALYRTRCAVCHGVDGRGGGKAAGLLLDVWGRPVRPANFTYGIINRGPRVEDIYLSITIGVDGTTMPSFAVSLTEEERWHLTSYVLSLMGRVR